MSRIRPPLRSAVREIIRATATLPWWLGRLATTWARTRPPTRARSPRISPALWRTNSSGQRSGPPISSVSESTTAESIEPPLSSPRSLSASTSWENPKVRARARSLRKLSPVMSQQPVCRRDHITRFALGDGERAGDPVGGRVSREGPDAGRVERVQPGLERPVEDGRLGTVELDDQVVEVEGHDRREEVLHRVNGGVAPADGGAPLGGL